MVEETLSRRFLSSFLDSTLVAVVTFLLVYFAAIPLLKVIPAFIEVHDATFTSIEGMYGIEEEAGLTLLNSDGNPLTPADHFNEYLRRQIDGSGEKAYEDDLLGHYFVLYRPTLFEVKDPLGYFIGLFHGTFPEWYFVDVPGDIPVLSENAAMELGLYLSGKGERPGYYDTLLDSYLALKGEALEELSGTTAYLAHYERYLGGFTSMAGYEMGALFMAFGLSHLSLVFLPSLIDPRGRSLGRRLASSAVLATEGKTLPFWKRLLLAFGSMASSAFASLLPLLFTFGFSVATASLIGGFDYLYVFVVSFVLFLVDKLPVLASDRQSLGQLLLKAKVVTTRYETSQKQTSMQ